MQPVAKFINHSSFSLCPSIVDVTNLTFVKNILKGFSNIFAVQVIAGNPYDTP